MVEETLYQAVVNHSTAYDGRVYVGIRSTKIVCFPSCRSRTPKEANIIPFNTLEAALEEGFRPCKRCRPDNPSRKAPAETLALAVDWLVRDSLPEKLTCQDMARVLHVSARHLNRTIQVIHGVSLSRRRRHLVLEQAKRLLRDPNLSVRAVGQQVGIASASYFSRLFAAEVGQTPMQYRKRQDGGSGHE